MNLCEQRLQYAQSVWFCLALFRDCTIFCFLCFGLINWPLWVFLNFLPRAGKSTLKVSLWFGGFGH